MTPFSVNIYKEKKFNTRKETVDGYGIKIFRFYKWWEITFKTNPKNTDYAVEHGASRNFKSWREEKTVEEERLAKLEEEEKEALENQTIDSKQEMDIRASRAVGGLLARINA